MDLHCVFYSFELGWRWVEGWELVGVTILGFKTELELEFKFEYHSSALESVNDYL